MFLFQCATVLLLLTRTCSITTVEYYQQLIYENSEKAKNYQLPLNNSEFIIGMESAEIKDFGTYDFIVVGAGSAGSVVATRLSENPRWKILVLEAGGEETDLSLIPAMYNYVQFSEMNWGYYTTPQKHSCLGMIDRKCITPRGKVIGGSSAINSLIYTRGNRHDFDMWAKLGNPGWSYDEVLRYFIKAENSQIDGDPGYHGKGGFWNAEHSQPHGKVFLNLIEAHKELGIPIIDYNGKSQIGVSKAQTNIKHGKRQGTGTAYLDNARARKNLKLKTRAFATKIVFDEASKVAEGVIFVTKNGKYMAKARKEVIVCAGAFNTPQLLMLSGIGPRKHLQMLGIEVIKDLPVGENLQEHPQFVGLAFHTNYTVELSIEDQIQKYLEGLGYLTKSLNLEGLVFLHGGNLPKTVPMTQFIVLSSGHFTNGKPEGIPERLTNFNDDLVENFLKKINPKTDFWFYISLLHAKSRGRITLKSNNPFDFPNIDLNLLSEPEDVDRLIEAIEHALKLIRTEAFQKINATLIDFPICQEFPKNSRSYWGCVVRHVTATTYHPSGTTPMGPNTATSVVDHNLQVHGIGKLRVVDAGVFPYNPSGNLNAMVIMVAEKISDVIKSNHE